MTSQNTNSKNRKLTVKERLREPHVLAEMLKLSLSQSSHAQKQFLVVLEAIADVIRDMLEHSELIQSSEINHKALWAEVSGKAISFIDGGMANVTCLGAEPVAVRVGSYTVLPGNTTPSREEFQMEKQLVAELFDLTSSASIYEDLFEDPSKLRDAARYCLELSAAVQRLGRQPAPDHLFLHGALVNPVSAYADQHFPAFSPRGLELLLGVEERGRAGREAKFVCVYLELLKKLQESGASVAAVVERASASTLVVRTLLDYLKTTSVSSGAQDIEEIKKRIIDYRIPDAVLFHAILNEGEYLSPIAVDRNVEEKRPQYSKDVIGQYPLPRVTYVGVGQFAQPLRVEFFEKTPAGDDRCIRLIIHSCRLMPNYAFPAGLDIVDKFAKVPNWMARPLNATMAVQLLKRALDTGNPKIIESAKRMLCGTKRDWLFRPTFTA